MWKARKKSGFKLCTFTPFPLQHQPEEEGMRFEGLWYILEKRVRAFVQ
jgi:hypothetical protein